MSIDDELDMDIEDILAEEAAERAKPKLSPLRHSHPDGADPITSPTLVQTQPGAMRTTGEMILHTRKAHRLFYGRRPDGDNPGYVGLTRFVVNVAPCWNAAAADDPYADLVLLDIEEAHQRADASLTASLEQLVGMLESLDGITINISQSLEPAVMELSFSVPWGFKAAALIQKYDSVVKHCLAAAHAGLLNDEDWHRIANAQARPIRNLFMQSTRFIYTGVTRDDVAANNQKAQRAAEKYRGREIPRDVLEGKRRAKIAPTIRANKSVGSGTNTLLNDEAS